MKKTEPHLRLMAYLDGEMNQEERRAFEKTLDEHPEWRDEMESMAAVVDGAKQLKLRRPDPAIWDNYWEEIDNRLHRNVGWIAAAVGSLMLIFAGVVKVLVSAENDVVRFGILLVVTGLIILFYTVIRGRLLELPRDRYRRIRR